MKQYTSKELFGKIDSSQLAKGNLVELNSIIHFSDLRLASALKV